MPNIKDAQGNIIGYQANGTYNDYTINSGTSNSALAAQKGIADAKSAYETARQNNDAAGMAAAHNAAEQWRSIYGYSGGTDGSEFIANPSQQTGGTGISNYTFATDIDRNNITPERAKLMGQQALNEYYNMNYGVDYLNNLYNDATTASYAAKAAELAATENLNYQNQYATQANILDIMRGSNAEAVATGATKGISGAQSMAALLGLQQQQQTADTELANQRNQLAEDQRAEIAANMVKAVETDNAVKEMLANLDLTKYGYDTQAYVGELDYEAALEAVLGEVIQSQNSANATMYNADRNLDGTKYAADANAAAYANSYSGSGNGTGGGTQNTTNKDSSEYKPGSQAPDGTFTLDANGFTGSKLYSYNTDYTKNVPIALEDVKTINGAHYVVSSDGKWYPASKFSNFKEDGSDDYRISGDAVSSPLSGFDLATDVTINGKHFKKTNSGWAEVTGNNTKANVYTSEQLAALLNAGQVNITFK